MIKKRFILYSIVILTLIAGSLISFLNFHNNIKSEKTEVNSTSTDNQKDNISKETQVQEISSQNIQNVNDKEQIPDSNQAVVLNNVPFIQQLPELERGCEVTSLAMLLQSAGVSVDKITLAKEIETVPFEDGNFYGNPNDGFVGDIYSLNESGYGVYHGPVFQLAQKYLPSQAIDLTGKDIQEVYKMLDIGAPIWVITNVNYAPLDQSEFETWQTSSGTIQITYSEHSVVIVGYDQNNVYINDPLADAPRTVVPRSNFEKAWVQMGSQAISYLPANN